MLTRRHVIGTLAILPFLPASAWAADGTETIPATALIQPAALADMLKGGNAPTILQVGFSALYDQAHIPAAIYAGPGRAEDGIANLKTKAAALPHDKLLVIYCGCCPWVKCPNMAAAYKQLTAMGFSNVKALYIDQNFGADWVDKGYPVTRPS